MLTKNYKAISSIIAMISIYTIKMRVEAFRRIIRALKDLLVVYHCLGLQNILWLVF
jgi:hypothetical protein